MGRAKLVIWFDVSNGQKFLCLTHNKELFASLMTFFEYVLRLLENKCTLVLLLCYFVPHDTITLHVCEIVCAGLNTNKSFGKWSNNVVYASHTECSKMPQSHGMSHENYFISSLRVLMFSVTAWATIAMQTYIECSIMSTLKYRYF